MTRSFIVPNRVLQYPLAKIVDLLAFESVTECAAFLRAHGLESEPELGIVYMERASFYYPETQPPESRSMQLIESKRECSYGELMNGGPLPVNPYISYTPHNSFDAAGCLKLESYEAKDQV